MGEITFILGGARSGKSRYALELAKGCRGQIVYLATSVPLDEEMRRRMEEHRRRRPKSWRTVEEPLRVVSVLKRLDKSAELVILDCLTIFISNLLLHYQGEEKATGKLEEKVIGEISRTISTIRKIHPKIIIVSNEVGMGIVPETSLGRSFRDLAGKVNQIVAEAAKEVFLLVAGLPTKLK